MIHNSQHKLDFDGLDLTRRTRYGTGTDWYEFQALAAGASIGSSEPMTSEQASAMFDGARVTLDRWGNREHSWQVKIWAANSRGLALGERDLASRTGDTPRVLGYEPPDGWGARTVWDAMVSSLSHDFDDVHELLLQRVYTLHLVCAPFGYADREITDVASFTNAAESDSFLIADGTSVTDWTSAVVDSGELRMTGENSFGQVGGEWAPVTPLDFDDYPYLQATIRFDIGVGFDQVVAKFGVGGSSYPGNIASLLSIEPSSTVAGEATYTWALDPEGYARAAIPTGGLKQLLFTGQRLDDPEAGDMWVDDVVLTNQAPSLPVAAVNLSGSAPTSGVIHLYDADTLDPALDEVLIYTSPTLLDGGYTPAIGDGSPLAAVPPGTYLAVAKLDDAQTTGFTITVECSVDGLGEEAEVSATSSLITAADQGKFFPVGLLNLPPVDVPRDRTTLRLGVAVSTSTTPTPTELYLLHLHEDAAITIVSAGVRQHLWLDDPRLSDLTPGVFIGDHPDRRDAHFPGIDAVRSWGRHRFIPPRTPVFAISSGWSDPVVEITHRPAFHHFAAHIEDT